MKKCENCGKIIWPWQKKLKVTWAAGEEVVVYYHKFECAGVTEPELRVFEECWDKLYGDIPGIDEYKRGVLEIVKQHKRETDKELTNIEGQEFDWPLKEEDAEPIVQEIQWTRRKNHE